MTKSKVSQERAQELRYTLDEQEWCECPYSDEPNPACGQRHIICEDY